LHFDYDCNETNELLEKLDLDEIVIDALLSEQTRPRITRLDDNLLIALRGVNLNANSNPEDMVSIRLFVGENLIVSTKKRDLLSVNDIVKSLQKNQGPKSSAEFLIELTYLLTNRMQDTIENLDEDVGQLEEDVLEEKSKTIRNDILSLRKEALILKRYISPQRDALNKLAHEKISWMDDYERVQLKEITDNLYRYVEELETLKDRITYVQEELQNVLSEKMNMKMYILSIISAVFLPLGFLTGLLGINVGGIPGAENPNSFWIFIGILVVLVGLQWYWFKKKKWI
jgi:zinc transporter